MNITNALQSSQTLVQGVNPAFTITPTSSSSVLSILPTDQSQTHNFTINSITIEKVSSNVTVTSDDIIQVVDYYPYGKVLREYVFGDQERYLTTQHERDQATGLDYRGARYYDSDVARFLSLDPLASEFPSWSDYNYVMGNPIYFKDPDGRASESTHIDENGNVIAVFNDGDNGVYQHGNNADGGTPTEYMIGRRQEKWGTAAHGKKVGETKYWDEFIVPGTDRSEGKIYTEASWDKPIQMLHDYTVENLNLYQIAEASRPNKSLDIKSNPSMAPNGPMTGRLLNGKFATARSAGNYLAGMNGRHGTLAGIHISKVKYMMLAGALHQGVYSKTTAGLIVMGKITVEDWPWPAPYYGEDEYAGRRIVEGWSK